jgi:hypothetical protein
MSLSVSKTSIERPLANDSVDKEDDYESAGQAGTPDSLAGGVGRRGIGSDHNFSNTQAAPATSNRDRFVSHAAPASNSSSSRGNRRTDLVQRHQMTQTRGIDHQTRHSGSASNRQIAQDNTASQSLEHRSVVHEREH